MTSILRQVDRLLAREIISLTCVVAAGITSVMIMAKLPTYANFLFSAPESSITFFMLLLYIVPTLLKLTLPISLLLASALVFARMSADRELEAWMAGGASLLRLITAPTVVGAIIAFLSLASALFLEPYSNRQFNRFKWVQTQNAFEAVVKSSIKKNSFVSDFPFSNNATLAFYFDDVRNEGSEFSNVLFFFGKKTELSSPFFISSSEGELKKKDADYQFSFFQGTAYFTQGIQPVSHKERNSRFDLTTTRFQSLTLSLLNAFRNRLATEGLVGRQTDELYPNEYWQMLQQERKTTANWQKNEKYLEKELLILKQILIPLSSLLLPLLGVCLGVQDPRRKQFGIYLGVSLVLFLFYASLSFSQQIILKFFISPYFILIVPTVCLILLGLILLRWRVLYPPSTSFSVFLKEDFFQRLLTFKKGK